MEDPSSRSSNWDRIIQPKKFRLFQCLQNNSSIKRHNKPSFLSKSPIKMWNQIKLYYISVLYDELEEINKNLFWKDHNN